MTTVLIGGSRAVSRLNPQLRHRLDHMMQCQARFVIGDSSGAERAVQQYLHSKDYRDVTVYCVRECLNNLGAWPVKPTGMPKERALVSDSKCGLILWDGKSRETLDLVRQLLAVRKRTLLYFAPAKTFHQFATASALDEFLATL